MKKVKISMPADIKALNGYDVDAIDSIKACFDENNDNVINYVDTLLTEVANSCSGFTVYRIDAIFAPNCRVNDAYTCKSGKWDVWMNVVAAHDDKGFYSIEAYLTDVWYGNIDKMGIRHFIETPYKY